jgi:hypothetical protein
MKLPEYAEFGVFIEVTSFNFVVSLHRCYFLTVVADLAIPMTFVFWFLVLSVCWNFYMASSVREAGPCRQNEDGGGGIGIHADGAVRNAKGKDIARHPHIEGSVQINWAANTPAANVQVPTGATVQSSGTAVRDLNVARELTEKATSAELRKECREEHLLHNREATERRNLQAARSIENSSKKRARERDTIHRYFTASRNFDIIQGNEGLDPSTSPSCVNNFLGTDQPSVCIDAISRANSS